MILDVMIVVTLGVLIGMGGKQGLMGCLNALSFDLDSCVELVKIHQAMHLLYMIVTVVYCTLIKC